MAKPELVGLQKLCSRTRWLLSKDGSDGLQGQIRATTRLFFYGGVKMIYEYQHRLTHHRRYAENAGIDDRHPLVRTLSIPSPILQTHRIEILVYTINAMTEPTNEGAASFLVPNLEMSNTSSGTPATMTYPVHKALLYEEGLNRLGTFATIDVHTETGQEGRMFKGVIDWSWSTSQQRDRAEEPVSPINLALAEAAIETFRRSLDKSIEYEHMWFDAGMPALTAWLLEGTEAHPNSMKPAVRRLIQTICDKVDQGILREEVLNMQKEKAATVPAATKNIINQAITIWAENAHNELRERLNAAFASRSWRKTKWWQLFWRVDDVGYVTSEILQRAWLVEAEKEMIWICGRIHQSGLLGPPKLRPTAPHNAEQEEQKLGDKPPAPSAADLVPQASNFNEPPAVEQAWPQDMARARSTLSSLTVPPLQALSQSLILQTVSTNVLASSLSSLLYISVSTTSPYESGAIAATGLVYSLRRLQKQWETARGEWDVVIREEGRRVLRHTEKLMRGAVEDVQPEIDEVGVRERAIAREAVEKVREALNERRG